MNRNTIIAVVLGLAILAFAAYLLFFSAPSSSALTSTTPTSSAQNTFVNLASQLEPLGFDTSILSDPRFIALIDIHTAIVPEAIGRRDPFAPAQ